MATVNKQRVPVLEKAWTASSSREKPKLIGSECPHCGEVYFPRKSRKLCVHCYKEGLEDIRLSRRGKIDAFTIITQQPGGGYYFGPVPYAMGVVELPEGVYIETHLKAEKLEDLSIGQEVELVIETIWNDTKGTELIGFKFQMV
jgi:uncharacterized OB-fold protein